MDFLKQGRSLISEKMHNTMIQHSVFAAVVFLVVAHPKTFQFVDSIIKVHDKNILLLVHALVVGLLMYFGSLYIFEPVQKVLLEGFEKEPKNVPKSSLKNTYTYGHATAEPVMEKKTDADKWKENVDKMHEKWLQMSVKDIVACDRNVNPDKLTLGQLKEKCLRKD